MPSAHLHTTAMPSACLRRSCFCRSPYGQSCAYHQSPPTPLERNDSRLRRRDNGHKITLTVACRSLPGRVLCRTLVETAPIPLYQPKINVRQTSGCLAVAGTTLANLDCPAGGPERPRLAPERPHRTGPAGPVLTFNGVIC